jgi:hypothetical protein
MILSVRAESIILSVGLLLLPLPPCCRHCCLCLRRGSSGGCMGVAVCRCRGNDVATTVVDFVLVFVFVFVFVFVAPRQWGRGVPPLCSSGYRCDSLVCHRSHCPWHRCPQEETKMAPTTMTVVTMNETGHGAPSTSPSNPHPREGKGNVGKGSYLICTLTIVHLIVHLAIL